MWGWGGGPLGGAGAVRGWDCAGLGLGGPQAGRGRGWARWRLGGVEADRWAHGFVVGWMLCGQTVDLTSLDRAALTRHAPLPACPQATAVGTKETEAVTHLEKKVRGLRGQRPRLSSGWGVESQQLQLPAAGQPQQARHRNKGKHTCSPRPPSPARDRPPCQVRAMPAEGASYDETCQTAIAALQVGARGRGARARARAHFQLRRTSMWHTCRVACVRNVLWSGPEPHPPRRNARFPTPPRNGPQTATRNPAAPRPMAPTPPVPHPPARPLPCRSPVRAGGGLEGPRN